MKRASRLQDKIFRIVAVCFGVLLLGLGPVVGQEEAPLPDPDGEPADMSKPVQVFILLGQSNMLGFGKISGGDGSLEHAVKEKGLYPYLVDDEGNWTVRKDVRNVRVMNFKDHKNEWMTISGRHIGPEIGIGHYVGNVLDAPVMILKSCIGNRSLGWDLLPPGSPSYAGQPGYRGTKDSLEMAEEKPDAGWYAGKQYDNDVESAKQVLENLGEYYPGAEDYEVAGFAFWQGAKDGGNATHAEYYEENLVRFIKALREDFDAPDAKFVVATMGHGTKGGGGNAGTITDAQLAVDGEAGNYPEFKGNVATFYSNPVSMGGSANGHYSKHAETYMNVGEGMGKAMAKLLVEGGSGSRPSAFSSGGRTSGSRSARREARTLSAEKEAMLHRNLLALLRGLLDKGLLADVPMPLSMTSARVKLVDIDANGGMSFEADNGAKARLTTDDLAPIDLANLAVLATKLQPDNKSAHGVAGVYFEWLGRTELADDSYGKAGSEMKTRMNRFFE